MVAVEIINQQKRIPLSPRQITRIAQKILKHEKVRRAHLSIVFVTDQRIRILNKRFLKRNRPTDVLAFDLGGKEGQPSRLCRKKRPPQKEIDGEIVISAGTAYNNARRFKTSPYGELILYVAHGILHLLGYDDHSPRARKKMRAKEEELMELIRSSSDT